MSIQAVAWVLEHSETRGVARLVLIAIANYADRKTGECWPAQRTIAHEARCSPGSISAAVRAAVELGELQVVDEGGPRRQARYRLTFASAQSASAERADSERSAERCPPESARSARQPGPSPAETALSINEPSMNRDPEAQRIARALGAKAVTSTPGRTYLGVDRQTELHHADDVERERVKGNLAQLREGLGMRRYAGDDPDVEVEQ